MHRSYYDECININNIKMTKIYTTLHNNKNLESNLLNDYTTENIIYYIEVRTNLYVCFHKKISVPFHDYPISFINKYFHCFSMINKYFSDRFSIHVW